MTNSSLSRSPVILQILAVIVVYIIVTIAMHCIYFTGWLDNIFLVMNVVIISIEFTVIFNPLIIVIIQCEPIIGQATSPHGIPGKPLFCIDETLQEIFATKIQTRQ